MGFSFFVAPQSGAAAGGHTAARERKAAQIRNGKIKIKTISGKTYRRDRKCGKYLLLFLIKNAVL